MKSTGIVRKIDDLGRVVIPRELRRTLDINEGQPMEIYTSRGMIILEKYTCDTLTKKTDNFFETLVLEAPPEKERALRLLAEQVQNLLLTD